MITLTLSAALSAVLARDGDGALAKPRSIAIDADSWPRAVAELRRHHEGLARHVFDEADHLRSGFLVAVADDVWSWRDGPPNVRPSDEVYLFTQIAGG